jgi:hypothetical protein
MDALIKILEGGPGSGNYGHKGRKGKVGGSLSTEGIGPYIGKTKGLVRVANPPKFKWGGGRSWDKGIPVRLPNGERVNSTVDTTWGKKAYIKHGDEWYSVNIFSPPAGWAVELRD